MDVRRPSSSIRANGGSGFYDYFSGKLPPVYTDSLMTVNDMSRSRVAECIQLANFCDLETSEKYKYAIQYLRMFPIRDLHHEIMFRSK